MITKNGLLRPNRNSTLITNSKTKTKPTRTDSNELDIDFNNIPTIQGTYRATKVNITAENTSKATTELMTDIKSTIRRASLHDEITTSKLRTSTSRPSTSSFVKPTIPMINEDEKLRDETKTTSPRTTVIQSELNTFQDIRDPDFETSPWKPIIPGYINTEFKLLPNHDITKTYQTESSTQNIVLSTSDNVKLPDVGISTTSMVSGSFLESINFRDVPGMSTFDTDNTGFPRDRIVPEEGSAISKLGDSEKPDIEMIGQLPVETYSIKLKASSKHDEVTSSSKTVETSTTGEISENTSSSDNALLQEKRRDSNETHQAEENLDQLLSTLLDDIGFRQDEEIASESPTSGIGVAEPVPDTEIELEAKNRHSDIVISSEDERKDIFREKNVDVNPEEPVYTSYSSPDLNSGTLSLVSSLIENSATMKPFRHTIPVDKITSALNYSDAPVRNSEDLPRSDDVSKAKPHTDAFDNKIITPSLDSEGIEMETSVTEHDNAQLPGYGPIAPTEPNVMQTTIDDDELSRFGITENYSQSKLDTKDADGKKSMSRNSTFVEIDIVKHTPGQLEKNSESYADEAIANDTQPDAALQKKIYNDTLKAYVVENFVTLTPIKSNTGVERLIRSRPKIDSSTDETSLLDSEQLFRTHNYTEKEGASIEKSTIPKHLSSEIQLDSVGPDEEKSPNHKSAVVEQIVEVVTSISTKVSSSIKGDPVILKFIIANSTALPHSVGEKTSTLANSGVHEASRSFGATTDTTEKAPLSTSKRPSNVRTAEMSDRKLLTLEENRVLLEKLMRFAQIRTDDSDVRIARNDSNGSIMLLPQKSNGSLNIDELKKIADVVTGNETLRNASLGFTLNRDGVEIFTKVLNKMENRTNETHAMSTIRKISKTTPNDGMFQSENSN